MQQLVDVFVAKGFAIKARMNKLTALSDCTTITRIFCSRLLLLRSSLLSPSTHSAECCGRARSALWSRTEESIASSGMAQVSCSMPSPSEKPLQS